MNTNIPVTSNQASAARFLFGITWGLVYSDSLLNSSRETGTFILMTMFTVVLVMIASLERVKQ